MKVTKLLSIALIVICVSFSMPAFSNPVIAEIMLTDPAKPVDPLLRLQEIKDMDKENLSATEKKELKKELKALKKEIRSSKNGIYLSIGAVIIIILLLILLL